MAKFPLPSDFASPNAIVREPHGGLWMTDSAHVVCELAANDIDGSPLHQRHRGAHTAAESGSMAVTRVPPPAGLSISSQPPSAVALSPIPTRP